MAEDRSSTISIHALREEGDLHHVAAVCCGWRISIHALREEGDVTAVEAGTNSNVFLSTPSARRATGAGPAPEDRIPISIHALREEGDSPLMMCETLSARFLSTPSARRATILLAPAKYLFWNFYPRPPRGGRRVRRSGGMAADRFLSTPSARRATGKGARITKMANDFYPRPPRGGRHERPL